MRRRSLFLVLGLALLLAWPALAQNPTGKLSGHVTNDGKPLPGVTVTASSPNLQGTRSAVTSANGDYFFASLPPGEYSVTFELSGLDTVKLPVTVAAAQETSRDAEMAVTRLKEEIVVTGNLETISEGPQSATTFTQKLVNQLPVNRSLEDIVALAPGVHATGPGKGSDSQLASFSISGAMSFESLFLINGVTVNENIRGQAFDLFIEDAVQETTTASAGVSAEYGRFSGGVVNVITKSGGNDFSGSFRTSLGNQSWQAFTPLTTTQTDKTIPTYEATLGGPALKDRLWFFAAGRQFDRSSTGFTAAPTLVPYTIGDNQKRYEGKLTAALTPQHSLIGSYIKIDETQPGNSFQTILDLKSVYTREVPAELATASYSGVLGQNFYLTGQYAQRKFTFINSGAPSTDLIDGTLLIARQLTNARYHSPTFCGVCGPEKRDNKDGLVKGSYFLSTSGAGTHEIVGGLDQFKDIRLANNHQSGSDYRILGTTAVITSSGDILPVFNPGSTIIQFNPIAKSSQGTDFVTDSAFVNDNWRLNDRFSFNLGLRYDKNDGRNAGGDLVARDSALSPRVAAVFDPKANGDWVFNLAYAKYVAAIANSIADSSTAAGQPATFQWTYSGPPISGLSQDDALRAIFAWFNGTGGTNNTKDLTFVSIPGLNTVIRGSLDSPNVQEYTLGLTKRLGSRGLVRADFIHRKFTDFYAQRTDLGTGQVTTPTGHADLTLVVNDNKNLERKYDGVDIQARYRFTRFDVGGGWTISHSYGNFDGENFGSGPIPSDFTRWPEYRQASWNIPNGDLAIDQRHKVNLYGIYTPISTDRHSLSVSLLQSYFSGLPYQAVQTIALGSSIIHNPGYNNPPTSGNINYFFSGRGAFRTDNVFRTDLALNYQIKFSKIDFFLSPQIINVFNGHKIDTTDSRYFNTTVFTADNGGTCAHAGAGGGPGTCLPFNPLTTKPVEGVNFQKGPNFGKAVNTIAFQQPRTFRFSVGLRF
ncbi:MAG TPA: TonB-dependent receptor [Thermoanaerobaculia bacterium]|jgi:outer membrane receptor protein involved in Fe transport